MGSLPEGLKYLIYISSSPPIQYCINLPKLFGLSPRTASLSYNVQSKLSVSLQAYVQILDQYNYLLTLKNHIKYWLLAIVSIRAALLPFLNKIKK